MGGVTFLSKLNNMDDSHFIFGSILVAANRMDTMLERALSKHDITAKQWFLSVVLDTLFEQPPTIKELAKEMGSSHQNVKQVALKLAQKGLLKLEKDTTDARATRLTLTDESQAFWAKTDQEGMVFMRTIYKNIKKDELAVARSVLEKMLANLSELEDDNG
ncbi:MAG: MarR family transcriptional regulator [Hyphomonadaceae bacterium]|nr:MarR family transcriptional regulator [Clostridia bacterium]